MQGLMRSWSERLEAVDWVRCPCCSTEYMKLRPCNYLDDNKRMALTHLCVKCAETLVAWDWIIFSMPLPSAFLTYIKWIAPREKRVGNRPEDVVDQAHNAYVVAEVGGTEIIAKSDGAGQPIKYKFRGQEEVHYADNVYQFRSKLVHTIPY